MPIEIPASALRAACLFVGKSKSPVAFQTVCLRYCESDAKLLWKIVATDSYSLFAAWNDSSDSSGWEELLLDARHLGSLLKGGDARVVFPDVIVECEFIQTSIYDKNGKHRFEFTRALPVGPYIGFEKLLTGAENLTQVCRQTFSPKRMSVFCKAAKFLDTDLMSLWTESGKESKESDPNKPMYIKMPDPSREWDCIGVLMPIRCSS